jgi:hypothetical protein
MKEIGEFETGGVTGTHTEKSVAMDFHITMYRGVASASAHKVARRLQQEKKKGISSSADLQASLTMA